MKIKVINKIKWLLKNDSQYSIAEKTGVAQPTLSYLKKGTRKMENLSVEVADKLVQYADDLFSEKFHKGYEKKECQILVEGSSREEIEETFSKYPYLLTLNWVKEHKNMFIVHFDFTILGKNTFEHQPNFKAGNFKKYPYDLNILDKGFSSLEYLIKRDIFRGIHLFGELLGFDSYLYNCKIWTFKTFLEDITASDEYPLFSPLKFVDIVSVEDLTAFLKIPEGKIENGKEE